MSRAIHQPWPGSGRHENLLRRIAHPTSGPRHASRIPFALLVAVLIVGGMALLLVLNTASAANELRRHDLAARDATIAARVQELQVEVAASAAPANVAAAAAALGMVPADNPAFLVIGADGVVHVMGSPAAVSPPTVALPVHHHQAASTSSTKSTTATATSTASPTGQARPSTSSRSAGQSTPTSTPTATPTPTPTPTPTLTLPGGNR